MNREMSPVADVGGLFRLLRTYRDERPDISLVSTPKAGLIAGLAAWLTRVPRRVYLLRGLRLETATGPRRWLLWGLEWIALHLGPDVIVVSPSLLARTRALHLLGPRRGAVLGRGASNGIDTSRFEPTPKRLADALAMRMDLGIQPAAFVFGFVGRLTVDKGIRELIAAFREIQQTNPQAWLLMVGEEELGGLPRDIRATLDTTPQVCFTGWLDDPALAYHVMDCLVLPTYREGFPNVPLEAAAAAKPVITTTATGAVDSIVHGVTGLLVEPEDCDALHRAMQTILGDRQRSAVMGRAGEQRVREFFTCDAVWGNLAKHLGLAPETAEVSAARRPD